MSNRVCSCCEKNSELRMGVCFDCAECESVIGTGLDMREKDIPKLEGFSSSMARLKYVLKKYHSLGERRAR